MFKQHRERKAAAERHRRLLGVAFKVVSRHIEHGALADAGPAEVIALAFGQHHMRISEGEALDYLNAALADRGYPLHSGSTPAGEQL